EPVSGLRAWMRVLHALRYNDPARRHGMAADRWGARRRRPLRLRRVPGARTDPEIPARGGRSGVAVETPDAAPRHREDGGRQHGGAPLVAGSEFSLVGNPRA